MMVRKGNRVTVVATCWEVLVVVLVISSAFSLAKFGISPLCLRETDFVGSHWWRWQDYQIQRPWFCLTLALTVSWFSSSNASDWDTDQVSLLCLGAAFACMADQRSGWLLSVLLLLPVSHYDVPQQGLLGELILIQQQIQRHEEEVRRAAAAHNARPPPPEPAPSPPPNPSPPQQKRKVKVPTHLAPPCPTNVS